MLEHPPGTNGRDFVAKNPDSSIPDRRGGDWKDNRGLDEHFDKKSLRMIKLIELVKGPMRVRRKYGEAFLLANV